MLQRFGNVRELLSCRERLEKPQALNAAVHMFGWKAFPVLPGSQVGFQVSNRDGAIERATSER